MAGRGAMAFDSEGRLVRTFPSAQECMRILGISRSSFDHAVKTGDMNRRTGLFLDYEINKEERR